MLLEFIKLLFILPNNLKNIFLKKLYSKYRENQTFKGLFFIFKDIIPLSIYHDFDRVPQY